MGWEWTLAHNLAIGSALRKANEHGWWDAAGYCRDEVKLVRRWKAPENKGPAFTSGSPLAGSLDRAVA